MSRLGNMEALEKQLASLQMSKESNHSPGNMKKVPPAVPPKKKAQPQVPHSAVVNNVCEPSFSAKISTLHSNSSPLLLQPPPPPPPPPAYYTNTRQEGNIHMPNKDYANVTQLTLPNVSFKNNVPLPSNVNNTTYSNLPSYQSCNSYLNDSPIMHLSTSKAYDTNHNHDEYLPPPSPVSSNYSELARATANINYNQERPSYPVYQNEFPDYGVSQASTYESLYEPINQHSHNRPTSATSSYKSNISKRSPLPKEQEVDALTNLLVQSISDSQDLDVFGTCVKCDKRVIGESSGCTAMGNMYHVTCFCCYHCNTNLQGKPFYAVEGQPYCELDYFETLEKCSVCTKPILDRILRATGKPYHPTCFTCVVCGKSLDGIPFTVDAMNQIHCIEDFHKKFAPRCCVCEMPIMPENGEEETVRVVALDRSFHVRCYCCEDCGLQLSSEAEGRGCYPLDGHILCKACNAHRIRMITNVMTTDL
ncbi:lipoma-preferred partner homolog [Leptidea sinapis]|uniref:LIM zinc-binding domain-containing protein n=1 Tax=Leptidea sinapis TaxID=189913 RepID=A0A5E4Q9F2_9NEOP|nr:lipoma-preferred partner homolog [Leptidea sinapis]VVC94025.1 unnamed protein product [Leptidea sinapis]